MRLGLNVGEKHPFAEPGTKPLSNHSISFIEKTLMPALEDFRAWSSRELFFFRSRVMFWDSDGMDPAIMFSKALAARLAIEAVEADAATCKDSSSDESSKSKADAATCKDSSSDESSKSSSNSEGRFQQRPGVEARSDSGCAKGQKCSQQMSSATSSSATFPKDMLREHTFATTTKTHQGKSVGIVVRKRNGGRGPITAESVTKWSEARQSATRSGGIVGHVLGQAYRPGKRKQTQANAHIFTSDVLLGRRTLSEAEVAQSLLGMKDFFNLLWGLQRSNVPYHDPPSEMFLSPTLDELRMQHKTLVLLAKRVFIESNFFKDWKPTDRVPDALLLAAMLRVKYSIVKKRGVWHILRLWLRIVMVLIGSQASCEHMGSVLRFMEKKHNTGRSPDTKHLVRAARLRAAGLRGCIFEAPFLQACLEHYTKQMTWPRQYPFLVQPRTHRTRGIRGMLGPSMTIHRLRTKYYPSPSSNSAVLRYPWLVGEHTLNKLDLAKPLAVHLLSRSLAYVAVLAHFYHISL